MGDGYTNHHGDHPLAIYPDGKSHAWTLRYSPGSPGRIEVTLDGKSVEIQVPREHQSTLTHFDRFGLVSTVIDGNGQEIYFDDLTYTNRQP
jgi:hypothetical protein